MFTKLNYMYIYMRHELCLEVVPMRCMFVSTLSNPLSSLWEGFSPADQKDLGVEYIHFDWKFEGSHSI